MNNVNEAREIGLRARRFRMAQGLSQQELAEKMNTTPQTISKYENEGVSNIDTIRRLSEVLGQDILQEERDLEGTVGEVGREILSRLIHAKGKLGFENLCDVWMFGMEKPKVSKEIFKLEKIGLCVREQYTNTFGNTVDEVYITAKGVITYINYKGLHGGAISLMRNYNDVPYPSNVLSKDEESVVKCKTYEDYLKEYTGFSEEPIFYVKTHDTRADLMKTRPIMDVVRDIPYKVDYKFDLCSYIRKNAYVGGLRKAEESATTMINCYSDILYRMICNLTQERLDGYEKERIPKYNNSWEYDILCDFAVEKKIKILRTIIDSLEGNLELIPIESGDNELFNIFEKQRLCKDGEFEKHQKELQCQYEKHNEEKLLHDNNYMEELRACNSQVLSRHRKILNELCAIEEPLDIWDDYVTTRRYLTIKSTDSDELIAARREYSNYLNNLPNDGSFSFDEWYVVYNKVICGGTVYDDIEKTSLPLNIQNDYARLSEEKGTNDYSKWFSVEEISDFIDENYPTARNDIERKMDTTIAEVLDRAPEMMEYFIFPSEWESNGLADKARKAYGVSKPTIENMFK